MSTAAIICEYNPFHNGHKFHIEETKRLTGADSVIAIMSGNFIQRGECAIYDKKLRAKAAILGGADLVLELPTVYACASAEFFALGAVRILNALGIVDTLSFGAETDEVASIMSLARLLAAEPKDFSDSLKKHSRNGLSFPASREAAVRDIMGDAGAEILSSPNNILGTEYCKALIKENSEIIPFAVMRKGAAHDTDRTNGEIASASHIRSIIYEQGFDKAKAFMPGFAAELFDVAPIHSIKGMEKAIIAQLVKMPAEALKNISDVAEGLENRIKAAAFESDSLDELVDKIKTKRYTHSRIRRIVLSAYLGITDALRRSMPPYIKILDHNEKGQKLIAAAKKTSALPLVRNTSQLLKLKDSAAKEFWDREQVFDRIFEFCEI